MMKWAGRVFRTGKVANSDTFVTGKREGCEHD
jgi:hypothetical protein